MALDFSAVWSTPVLLRFSFCPVLAVLLHYQVTCSSPIDLGVPQPDQVPKQACTCVPFIHPDRLSDVLTSSFSLMFLSAVCHFGKALDLTRFAGQITKRSYEAIELQVALVFSKPRIPVVTNRPTQSSVLAEKGSSNDTISNPTNLRSNAHPSN